MSGQLDYSFLYRSTPWQTLPRHARRSRPRVERHHNLFPPNGSDEQWLEYVGNNSRIALTHNERIRYTPNELAAVIRHTVGAVGGRGQSPTSCVGR
jgi:PIN like domain